jgi:hypothetical protein
MQNQNLQQQLDFSKASDIVCDDCGGTTFVVKYFLKRFSALISPTGDETIVPISAFACSKCGHINEEFIPE